METTKSIAVIESAKQSFVQCMDEAKNLDIVNNTAAAFEVAVVVNRLRDVLNEDIMKQVFMPLQGQKIGFRTDKIYSVDVVRNCIIDAAANGLMPTGNQFNIIAGNMYPTKEGYTALLARLKQSDMKLVYSFEFDPEAVVKSSDPSFIAIPCRCSYKTTRDDLKGVFKYVALVKVNRNSDGQGTSNIDQLRGKAERKCKKAFFEFLTGLDLGDGDADTIEAPYVDVTPRQQSKPAERTMESVLSNAMSTMTEAEIEQELDAAAAELNFEGGNQ